MGILTVSRMYGTGGSALARTIADCLGWTYVDREFIERFCAKARENISIFSDENAETSAFYARFPELITDQRFYRTALMTATYLLALRDNIVFAGRGAHIMMADIPDAVSVQVVREMRDRVKAVAEVKNISAENAAALIVMRDAEKREFMDRHFGRPLTDALQFDLIINASRVPFEAGVELLCAYANARNTPATRSVAERVLQKRLLEKYAQLLLYKLDMASCRDRVDFTCEESGALSVHGEARSDVEKNLILSGLRGIRNIGQIEDHLSVAS